MQTKCFIWGKHLKKTFKRLCGELYNSAAATLEMQCSSKLHIGRQSHFFPCCLTLCDITKGTDTPIRSKTRSASNVMNFNPSSTTEDKELGKGCGHVSASNLADATGNKEGQKVQLVLVLRTLTDVILRHGELPDLDVNRPLGDVNHLHVAWERRGGGPIVTSGLLFFFTNTEETLGLYITKGGSMYSINSISPKKDKVGGQKNPLLFWLSHAAHTHAHTHSHTFRRFTNHTIEGEICFLSPLYSMDDLGLMST